MTALKKIFFEFSVAYLKNHSTYLKTITAKTNENLFVQLDVDLVEEDHENISLEESMIDIAIKKLEIR